MKSKSKRPLVVTILAIAQVWIGCVNLLTLPINGIMLWGRTAERFALAHASFRPLAQIAEILFLMAYTGIGIGLWR
jgi:hypothetical protein